jgi:hypothetical protein
MPRFGVAHGGGAGTLATDRSLAVTGSTWTWMHLRCERAGGCATIVLRIERTRAGSQIILPLIQAVTISTATTIAKITNRTRPAWSQ